MGRPIPVLIAISVLAALSRNCVGDAGVEIRKPQPARRLLNKAPREVICPVASDIKPCLCEIITYDGIEFYLNLDCSAVESEEQLANVFKHDFPNTTVTTFTIENNYAITNIGPIFRGVSFEEIQLTNLPNLTRITADAFLNSVDFARIIYILETQLTEDTFPLETLERYTKLEKFGIQKSKITKLPNLVSASLDEVRFVQSEIEVITSETLAGVPFTQTINVGFNKLTTIPSGTYTIRKRFFDFYGYNNNIVSIEPGAFAVEPTTNDTLRMNFDFSYNNLTTIDEAVFGVVMPYIYILNMKENPLECGCDVAWIVLTEGYLAKMAPGTYCSDGTILNYIDPTYYEENC